MKRYGILGHPLTHTMSPFLHERLFRLSGVEDFEYRIYDVVPEQIDERRAFFRSLDGFNVTIPYKIETLSWADKLSEGAERYRSVNCFVNRGGVLSGFNTDADGFLGAIGELGASLSGRVLLLGAGGVANMMAVEAVRFGASLTIAARASDLPAARALAARASAFGKSAQVTTLDAIDGAYELLINATPVGMYPNVGASPVSESVVKRSGAVFDAVYNPTETALYRLAATHGIPAATGMSMLVLQAVKAHELWYGAAFRPEDLRKLTQEAARYTEENFR